MLILWKLDKHVITTYVMGLSFFYTKIMTFQKAFRRLFKWSNATLKSTSGSDNSCYLQLHSSEDYVIKKVKQAKIWFFFYLGPSHGIQKNWWHYHKVFTNVYLQQTASLDAKKKKTNRQEVSKCWHFHTTGNADKFSNADNWSSCCMTQEATTWHWSESSCFSILPFRWLSAYLRSLLVDLGSQVIFDVAHVGNLVFHHCRDWIKKKKK